MSDRPVAPQPDSSGISRIWLWVLFLVGLVLLVITAAIVVMLAGWDATSPTHQLKLDEMQCSTPDVTREDWRGYLFITTRTLCEGTFTNTTDTDLHVEIEASITNHKMGDYLASDTDFVEVDAGESADFKIVLGTLTRSEFSLDQVDLAVHWARDDGGEVRATLNCENWRNTGSVQIVCTK